MSESWIGVDFDGTLAHYTEWKGELVFGEPIPEMVDRVKRWLSEGREVRILTARVDDRLAHDMVMSITLDGRPDTVQVRADEHIRAALRVWCRNHIGQALPITNMKDFLMLELWDDRAVQVELNTGRLIGRSTRGL